ncbi:ATP-binding protein [Methyloprofundus sp.]|uniref:hybrid sensor histidine kinase/response regulator n=1 Tax=Methyloprofundus sp. TaxID=2020875 RepID=UPI003D0E20B1
MNAIEKTYHKEIEVERLWSATKQGEYMFFSILPISIILVFMLWDDASHRLLLIWFSMVTAINFLRWMSMQFYYTHKAILSENVAKFKWILMIGSLCAGLSWGIAEIWFLQPAQPVNVLIMTLYAVVVSMGAILSWFCYLPAVLAIIIPIAGTSITLLLIHASSFNIAISLLFSLLVIIGSNGSIKLTRILNHALMLNFENVDLRRESEEKSLMLETALENMAQGISMSDSDDKLRMWNKKFTNLLGAVGSKVASNIDLKFILNAADPPLKAKANTGTEYRTQDGRVFEIRQTKLQHNGRVITYTDISDLIKRERALEEARKTAEQANAAKTRFLAAASHDLRQPIHALGLFFAELSDRVQSPETGALIIQVNDSITAINSMLNALLDVSKLDAGVVKPNIECFSLKELLSRLESDFISIARENHNQLRIRPPSAIVSSDPAMLERMLRNLIGNALRYTQNGRVLVAARPRGETVQIQVFDNGIGIPKDQLEDIFIEFHQLGNPARDRRQGLGLGLAIVKRLTRLLGHQITVSSEPGKGSCFSITLPVASIILVESVKKTRDYSTTHLMKGSQVMVLDDDSAVLEGMYGLLTHWGFEVITANSPADAFYKLKNTAHKLKLLIIDYRLPDSVSGIEVAKKIQSSIGSPLPVLIITGDTGPERLQEADASGYPLLHKPVQPAKLRSIVHYLLSK